MFDKEPPEMKGRSITLSVLNATITVTSSYPQDDINSLKALVYEILEKVNQDSEREEVL